MLGKVFARFVEKSPISVMVRGTLNASWERSNSMPGLPGPPSSTPAPCCFRPSMMCSARWFSTALGASGISGPGRQGGASLISLYNKLNEPTHTSAAWYAIVLRCWRR